MRRKPLHQGLERPAPPAAGSDLAVTVLASFSIAVPLLFYLHQHVEMLRYGYEIEALEQRKVALVERHRELHAKAESLASLPRVEQRAATLGLTAPDVLGAAPAVGGPEASTCLPDDGTAPSLAGHVARLE